MTYGPAELGDRQADARPYGDSSAEIEAERLRREAAVGGAPAQPRTPASRGPSPDAVDRNAGYMVTPPQPSDTPPGGQELLGHAGGPNAQDYLARFTPPHVPAPAPENSLLPAETYDFPILGGLNRLLGDYIAENNIFSRFNRYSDAMKRGDHEAAYAEIENLAAGMIVPGGKIPARAPEIIAADAARLTSVSQRLHAVGATAEAKSADEALAGLTREMQVAEAEAKAKAEAAKTPEAASAAGAGPEGAPPSAEKTPPANTPPGQAGQGGAPPTPPAKTGAEPPAAAGPEPNLGINFEKIDAPPHVVALIRQEAMANLDAITQQRRGVQTLDVIYAKARNLGIDVPALSEVRPGTAFNAEGAVSVFNAIVRAADKRAALETQVREAGTLASPELEARLLAAIYDQSTLQRVFAGGRAELGRGMRALRELADGANAGRVDKDTFARALDAIGGRANMDKLVQRLKDIQTNPNLSPLQREIASYNFVGALQKPRFWDKVNELFVNSILSNPLTHVGNVLGQSALAEADAISQIPGAIFDAVVTVGGRRAPRTRTVQGAVVAAVAQHAAAKRGLQEALLYLRTGVASEAVEKFRESGRLGPMQALQDVRIRGKNVAPVGTVINFPTRALGAEDVFFNAMGRDRQLHLDAANFVFRDNGEHIFSKSSWERVADVLAHPEDFLMDGRSIASRAEEAGRRAGLRQDAGELPELLTRVRDIEVPGLKVGPVPVFPAGLAPLKFITPFVRIGFNLARVGAEYSPLGFVRVATQRGGTQADAFGRAVVGTALWSFFWSKADSGELTGPAPSDPRAAADFYDSGKRPYAIRVGDRWVEYGRYEPIATTLKWIHGLHEAYGDVQQGLQDPRLLRSAGLKIIGTMARSLTDSSYLSGFSDFFDIVQSSDSQIDQKITRFAGNLANSIAPYSGARRFIAQRLDPTLRHPSDAAEQIEASNPGLSESVRPYLTHWGEPVQRPDLTGGLTTSGAVVDPVDVELAKHQLPDTIGPNGETVSGAQIFVSLASQDIGNFNLTPDEGVMLQQVAGRATHTALADLFADQTRVNIGTDAKPVYKRFSELDERQKVTEIQQTIVSARSTARATVADAILDSATSDDERRRGIAMRLKTLTKAADRAQFLLGQQKAGRLTESVRDYLNRTRSSSEPPIDEQLRAAALIPTYAALPKGDARRTKMLDAYPFLKHYVSGL